MGGFYGVDKAESGGSQNLQTGPQLDASSSIEKQASSLARQTNKVDDLTFREGSVRDVSDRGRQKVIDDLMRSLVVGLKRTREQQRTERSKEGVSKAQEEVATHLASLRRLRGSAGSPAAALQPLQRLAALPVDTYILRRTKVAVELNQEFWKRSASSEVQRIVAKLVKEWKVMFRKEEDGPSERTLRNSAADLENSAHSIAPKTTQYSPLVEALLRKLESTPDLAASVVEGFGNSFDLVTRVQRRTVAEKNNAGSRLADAASAKSTEKRVLRLEDGTAATPEKRKRVETQGAASGATLPFAESGGGAPAAMGKPEPLDLDPDPDPALQPPHVQDEEAEDEDPFGHGFGM